MVTERKYLVATPLKTDAAPWSLLVLSEVTVLGISLSLPRRGSAQEVHWVPNPMVLPQQAQKMPEELHSLEQCNPVVLPAAVSAFPSQG